MKRSIAAALSTILLLGGCALVPGAGTAKEPAKVVNGNSQFTPDGVKNIKASGRASFDVSQRPLTMAALGFPEGSDGILISTDPENKIQVSIKTPTGVVTMVTDTIRVRPGVPVELVDHIDFFYHFPDAQDATGEIRRATNELGFRYLDEFPGFGPEFKEGTGKESWNPGFGNFTGTVFSVEAILNRTSGSLMWIYSLRLADKLYTPENSASIAETGDIRRS